MLRLCDSFSFLIEIIGWGFALPGGSSRDWEDYVRFEDLLNGRCKWRIGCAIARKLTPFPVLYHFFQRRRTVVSVNHRRLRLSALSIGDSLPSER